MGAEDRATPDDLDNLFNYDKAVDDFLKDLPIDKDQNHTTAANEPTKNIDEEITVKKKRKPVPKLDESLLQSEKGLPRLRKITKTRLKFKGKGHEFSDMSRLLNTYQLWLDELYPRVKFRDGLAMVEKLGHSKRMQVMRRAWLDETKPGADARELSPERGEDVVMSGGLGRESVPAEDGGAREGSLSGSRSPADGAQEGAGQAQRSDDAPDDDELDALMADEAAAATAKPATSQPQQRKGPFDDDDDDDDLDALMAEQSASNHDRTATPAPPQRNGETSHDYADDEEAMADMGMW
ncbi:chromosome segregation in meiosis- protein [Saxophila tyrrhenica]|uniref:Chromosome segregation in meiosis protein n=1 Tax=Saxophila tyrrhenica TaxID=1690608 RepID=A0AAV9P952_9PEZI|nr:chromosome segregation in meiosis- protein [Saxophila tyrrhenica]